MIKQDKATAEKMHALTSHNFKENGPAGRLLVVIVNYKSAQFTKACLQSLAPEIERLSGSRVTVVDNASGDGPALEEMIRSRKWDDWVTLTIAAENGGFAAGNNIAIRPALVEPDAPRFFLLLNPDTEVRPGALHALIEFMESNPKVGIAGSGIENLDGTDWPIAFRFITPKSQLVSGARLNLIDRMFPNGVVARRMGQDRPAPVDWVAGASMIVRAQVFEEIGLLDEGYFLYFDEVDFCLRARLAGWPCWYVPKSRIMHIGGQSTGMVGIAGAPTVRDTSAVPRVPTYWFESRRRYFLKNFGLAATMLADLGFCFGYATWKLRRRLQGKPDFDPPNMMTDFWRHSVLFGAPRSVD